MKSLSGEYARTEQALLAGAGLDAYRRHADYRLVKRGDGWWKICSLSPKGYEWVRSGMNEALKTGTHTSVAVNLTKADRLLKEARAKGFITEFVGLSGLDCF